MKPNRKAARDFTVRTAEKRDLRAIVELRNKLDSHHRHPRIWPPEGGKKQNLSRYRQMLNQSTARLFVVESNGHKIVGYLAAVVQTRKCSDRDYRRAGAISEAFVERRYRRHGIGRSLVEAATRFFLKRKVRHITVRNVVFNKLANGFWERLSFRPVICTRTTNLYELTRALQRRKHRS